MRMGRKVPTIIQVREEEFRLAGKHGDMLLSILKDRPMDIKDDRMLIRTNLIYEHPHNVIVAFNHYLAKLRKENVIAINVILD